LAKIKQYLSPPHMGQNELKYIKAVFDSNYIAPLGEYVDKFEDSIANLTKSKYVLALNSGTSAIHLALCVLGVGKGDEVFASSWTFIGSVAPVLYQGADLFFIDSDLSWNISPSILLDELKHRVDNNIKLPKVLIITHLYGQMADIENISKICKEYDIYLIEDSAESLGATYKNKQSGSFGDFGIFSFNGNKILTTSGGGMLVSNNEKWIEKARFLSTQAREPFIHYEHKEIGYNYRLSNVLASIGVAQMEMLDFKVSKKREIFSWYQEYLQDKVEYMLEIPNSKGNRWLSTILFPSTYKKALKALNDNGFESRPLWKPMHLQPLFKSSKGRYGGVSEDFFKRGLCLPSGSAMNKRDVKEICDIILVNL